MTFIFVRRNFYVLRIRPGVKENWTASPTGKLHTSGIGIQGLQSIRAVFGHHHTESVLVGNERGSVPGQERSNIRLRIVTHHADIAPGSYFREINRKELH